MRFFSVMIYLLTIKISYGKTCMNIYEHIRTLQNVTVVSYNYKKSDAKNLYMHKCTCIVLLFLLINDNNDKI